MTCHTCGCIRRPPLPRDDVRLITVHAAVKLRLQRLVLACECVAWPDNSKQVHTPMATSSLAGLYTEQDVVRAAAALQKQVLRHGECGAQILVQLLLGLPSKDLHQLRVDTTNCACTQHTNPHAGGTGTQSMQPVGRLCATCRLQHRRPLRAAAAVPGPSPHTQHSAERRRK